MANLIEIDLDNHFVTELPEGQKETFANLVAIDNGWTQQVPNAENKEELGSKKDLDKIVKDFTDLQRLISLDETEETGVYKLIYRDATPIDNPISAFDYAMRYVQLQMGVIVRKAVKNNQLKDLKKKQQEEFEATESQLDQGLNAALDTLKVL